MKSKEWKIVSLQTSNIRQVRTGLRVLLRHVIQTELDRLNDLMDLYRKKRIDDKSTPSQLKRDMELYQAYYDLDYALHHSVLLCSEVLQCRSLITSKLSHNVASLPLDMVWNPLEKAWVCINCYNYYYKTDEQKQKYAEIHKKDVFDN